jgi:hypothetical protein
MSIEGSQRTIPGTGKIYKLFPPSVCPCGQIMLVFTVIHIADQRGVDPGVHEFNLQYDASLPHHYGQQHQWLHQTSHRQDGTL